MYALCNELELKSCDDIRTDIARSIRSEDGDVIMMKTVSS